MGFLFGAFAFVPAGYQFPFINSSSTSRYSTNRRHCFIWSVVEDSRSSLSLTLYLANIPSMAVSAASNFLVSIAGVAACAVGAADDEPLRSEYLAAMSGYLAMAIVVKSPMSPSMPSRFSPVGPK